MAKEIVLSFTDPLAFKWDGTNSINLARAGGDLTSSRFRNTAFSGLASNAAAELLIRQQLQGKRNRREVRVDLTWLEESLVSSTVSGPASLTAYLVVNSAPAYYAEAASTLEVGLISGLCQLLTASTNANAVKLANGEL
jgi:hypothetical protein